jgi:2,3-bisphosphoglycerate-independent phosphoglycerate mutase
VKKAPPLAVLVLEGVAERWAAPPEASPLARARKPNLDRLAAEGRVLSVRLVPDHRLAHGAGALLAILGFDPSKTETSRASYLGALSGEPLAGEECFLSADFLALFRGTVADAEPGPFKPAETEILLRAADQAMRRAGFRLLAGAGARHVAIATRASVDALVPPPELLVGQPVADFEPEVAQHAFAHRLARDVLDGHEINEVRRDLGRNGADMVWLWGPGGPALLHAHWDAPVSALGSDVSWRGICKAAGIPLRVPNVRTPPGLQKGLAQALKGGGICFVHAHRGTRDALLRDGKARAEGIADLDENVVAPVAKAVAQARGRLLVVTDVARESATGQPFADPVPALLWGAGIDALRQRPFTEAGAAAAGDPLEPGHGLLAYVRHL